MFKKLCLTAAMVAAAATSFAGDLVINGSTTVLPVVQKATEAFAKTNPDVHIALSGGGSGNGGRGRRHRTGAGGRACAGLRDLGPRRPRMGSAGRGRCGRGGGHVAGGDWLRAAVMMTW